MSTYQDWRTIPYPKESSVPKPVEPTIVEWRLSYFRRISVHGLTMLDGSNVKLQITSPQKIDFHKELKEIDRRLLQVTEQEKLAIPFWSLGPVTKQWMPLTDCLINGYNISAPRAARILSSVNTAALDAFIICWKLKYTWNVARPVQMNPKLQPLLPTPKHPAYPAAHSVIAGTIEMVLSYFFPTESKQLKALAYECSDSCIPAGVHFPADCQEGLTLGRQIGQLIVQQLKYDRDHQGGIIDIPMTFDKNVTPTCACLSKEKDFTN